MFRHRKRLISKRLTRLMRIKNQQHLRDQFRKFVQRKFGGLQQALTSQNHQNQQLDDQSQDIDQQEQQIQQEIEQQQIDFQDYDDDEPVQQQMTITDYIASMSPQEKRQFKRQNPQLPETFFMTKKQKQKFFAKKNNQFSNALKKTPIRNSKNKKHVQFKQKYVYKPFSEADKVTQIKKAKQLTSVYDSKIHFS